MSYKETTDECEDNLRLSFWEERCRLNKVVFDWCLRNAERSMREAALEKSLQWALLGARIGSTFPFDQVASPALEEHLLRIAKELPVPKHNAAHGDQAYKRWLHVLTEAYPTGGHTALVRRWIELDTSAHRHSVVLLNQKKEIPSALRELVRRTGGEVLKMDTNAPLLSRAMQLREAGMEADVVVLHIHPWEVISVVALGVCYGPLVLLMNIADHGFWIGGSVADVVLNLRESGEDWIVRHRGIRRINYLPILLPTPDSLKKAGESCSELRASMRQALALPLDAPVLLTVGDAYKYKPIPGLNFFDAARVILTSCPEAYLLVVGPSEVGDWKALRQVTGGRVRAVGLQTDVSMYRACADIYLEGFPFGSNTAFLEACIEGIPCVRAPRVCPPLVTSDGVAPKQLEQPADVAAYVRRAIELIADKDERRRCGESLATAIRERHTGSGWLRYLRNIETQLPPFHSVYHLPIPEPVPRRFADYWTQFLTERYDNPDPLNDAYCWALNLGLKPKVDALLMKTVRSAKHVRGRNAVHEVLIALLGPMLSMLPTKTSSQIYKKVVCRLCHDGRIMRTCRWVIDGFSLAIEQRQ
jgi:glycosyltransferase involved in cell wall biosynthesis